MTLLVADVGGTNTRIALAEDGQQGLSGLERYQNADFASFYDVLSYYGASRQMPDLTGLCVAVAGPVTSSNARLTNLDWSFDVARIAGSFASLSVGTVNLVNDLAALGFSLPDLAPAQLSEIRPSSGPKRMNHQALVVGVGTGFNICLVKTEQGGPVVVEAELGHASLPVNVSHALAGVIGAEAGQFATYEHLFSGGGLSRLHRIVSGGCDLAGPEILAGYDPARRDALALTTETIARALGIVARELVFQYLPYGGIHFAGGAARGLVGSRARAVFLAAFNAPGPLDEHVAMVPLRLITDDAAALIGARRYAHRAEN